MVEESPLIRIKLLPDTNLSMSADKPHVKGTVLIFKMFSSAMFGCRNSIKELSVDATLCLPEEGIFLFLKAI